MKYLNRSFGSLLHADGNPRGSEKFNLMTLSGVDLECCCFFFFFYYYSGMRTVINLPFKWLMVRCGIVRVSQIFVVVKLGYGIVDLLGNCVHGLESIRICRNFWKESKILGLGKPKKSRKVSKRIPTTGNSKLQL